MSNMIIVKPLTISIGGTFPNIARALTQDPKEAAIDTVGGARTIDIDLGSSTVFDTIYIGYTNDSGSGAINVTSGAGSYTTNSNGTVPAAASDVPGAPRHFLGFYPDTITARYVRLAATFPAGFAIGNVAVGKAFIPEWGHELGAGRPIVDTSAVERLFGGGFGIDLGVTAGGWQWVLGDLQNAELRALYALIKSQGIARTTLVVEDPDLTAGLNERIHWGLLGKLEPYQRLGPLDSSWSLSISDWA